MSKDDAYMHEIDRLEGERDYWKRRAERYEDQRASFQDCLNTFCREESVAECDSLDDDLRPWMSEVVYALRRRLHKALEKRQMKSIKLTEYRDERYGDNPVFINPEEVACVREWRYHSFRPAIAEVVLKHGTSIRVWETVNSVMKRMQEPQP